MSKMLARNKLVVCKNCFKVVKQDYLKAHESKCQQRLMQCPDCGSIDSTASDHAAVCPQHCTCKHGGTRRHNQGCPRRLLPCEFVTIGCGKTMKHSEVSRHNSSHMVQHLRGVVRRLWQVDERYVELKNELRTRFDQLEEDHDERTNTLADDTQQAASYGRDVDERTEIALDKNIDSLKRQLVCLKAQLVSVAIVLFCMALAYAYYIVINLK